MCGALHLLRIRHDSCVAGQRPAKSPSSFKRMARRVVLSMVSQLRASGRLLAAKATYRPKFVAAFRGVDDIARAQAVRAQRQLGIAGLHEMADQGKPDRRYRLAGFYRDIRFFEQVYKVQNKSPQIWRRRWGGQRGSVRNQVKLTGHTKDA